MNSKKLIQWALIFFVVLTAMQYFNRPKTQVADQFVNSPVAIVPASSSFTQGQEVIMKVTNKSDKPLTIENKCPANPLSVLVFDGTTYQPKTAATTLDCARLSATEIAPGKTEPISFKYWNNALFSEPGKYKVEMSLPKASRGEDPRGPLAPAPQGDSTASTSATPVISTTATASTTPAVAATTISSPEFAIEQAGSFRMFFRTAFYQPLLNALVYIISVLPYQDLGFAIIIITILIRLILLVPSQRALISQRKMQALQPRLEKIKKEFHGNQEKIAQETMKLWKDNKVNPFGSCLPLLIQFPFLIAIFYVIQSGLNPDNTYQLYGALKNFDYNSMNTLFLGILELTKPNAYVLPLIVGALQFGQMKLSFAKKTERTARGRTSLESGFASSKRSELTKETKPQITDEIAAANKSMIYVMPVMIGLFTASVPAGVGLYWAASTLFAIGQQIVVNKKA